MADCAGYDARWHEDLGAQVEKHHEAIHGNGDLGLKTRVSTIETYIADRKHDRMWLMGILAGILVLLGHQLINDFMGRFQLVAPQVTQTSTSTVTDTTSTTKTQKPTGR